MDRATRKVVFLTGTRADFGKLKPLMQVVDASPDFECSIFATGMHLLSRYGLTVEEISKAGFRRIYPYMNQVHGESMELALANTVYGLSRYVQEYEPDLLVVHGDRAETLAGAIVGSLRNILVAHIEGGEISGTVDELVRHAVSKLSHLHFVASPVAEERLIQLGERPESIHVIGSPDIDMMLAADLPSLEEVKVRYDVSFDSYGIVLFHPVTTDAPALQKIHARELVAALLESGQSFVVIYPNNDKGCEYIFEAYEALNGHSRFRLLPSLRFEYFLTLLKHSHCLIGNSSAGIYEAPVYAVPSINIGSRQSNRFRHESILDVACEKSAMLVALSRAGALRERLNPCYFFGDGSSARRFFEILTTEEFWKTPKQKQFCDLPYAGARQ